MATSVDGALIGPGSLRLPSVVSAWDSQAVNMPLKVAVGTSAPPVAYAVDDSGQIALAATVYGESVTFSAESTVIAFVRVLSVSAGAIQSSTTIDEATRTQERYAAVVAAIAKAVSSGSNPFSQTQIIDALSVLVDGVVQSLGTLSSSSATVHTLALPATRPLTTALPWILFTQGSGTTLSLDRADNKNISVRNSSSLYFNVALLDADGGVHQLPLNGKLAGVSIERALLGAGEISVFPKDPVKGNGTYFGPMALKSGV